MTINELKFNIENKVSLKKLVIFKISDNDFIPIQYIKEISKYENKSIKYIELLDEIDTLNVFNNISNDLYVYRTDNFDLKDNSIKTVTNLFIICKKITTDYYNEYIIEVPKLEDWQIKDYVYSLAEGVDTNKLDELINSCKNNIYALEQEINKLFIFSKDERKYVFEQLELDNAFGNTDEYNIFNFSNALIKKDIETLFKIYKKIKSSDIDPIGLVTILYNNFKNIINVQLSKNASAQELGLTPKQFWAIKYSCGYYSKEQLINAFKVITNIDKLIKTGYLSANDVIDYLLIKIL